MMDTDQALTVNNAAGKLAEAESLLRTHIKKNAKDRKKMPKGYMEDLEARITQCKFLIASSTMTVNPPTLQGSPNDPPPRLEEPTHPNGRLDQDPATQGKAPSKDIPNVIDPTLDNRSPARTSAPRHRKIIEVDPFDVIAQSLDIRTVAKFNNSFVHHEDAVRAADPSSTAEVFMDLSDIAEELMDQVEEIGREAGLSYAQLKWKIEHAGGPLKVSDLIGLYDWLVMADYIIVAIPQKPATASPKVAKDSTAVKIYVNGIRTTMTFTMMNEARKEPSKYPGCVEAGMKTVAAVFQNRSGNEKCITCASGPRGRALGDRPIPPASDHPYLEACKCPLRTAALEMWMIKVTAEDEDIPQRGDTDVKNSRLALNPDILKLIAGAIKVASGHDVDSLLQPEPKRLEHTIHWALEKLHSMAEDDSSIYAPSFLQLSDKLKDTMQHIADED
ncbi:hypothetical protein DFH06DRAFT_1485368 [Mycena polygramma]|nr:hypothetical protein DFH06DRAFT_1485368 [Mycena polygramma]